MQRIEPTYCTVPSQLQSNMITTCADDTFRKKRLQYKTKNLPSVVTRSNRELYLAKINHLHNNTQ